MDRDTVPSGDKIVAHLMNEHDRGDDHDKGRNGEKKWQAEKGQFDAPVRKIDR
jgi:hypothetical protein